MYLIVNYFISERWETRGRFSADGIGRGSASGQVMPYSCLHESNVHLRVRTDHLRQLSNNDFAPEETDHGTGYRHWNRTTKRSTSSVVLQECKHRNSLFFGGFGRFIHERQKPLGSGGKFMDCLNAQLVDFHWFISRFLNCSFLILGYLTNLLLVVLCLFDWLYRRSRMNTLVFYHARTKIKSLKILSIIL